MKTTLSFTASHAKGVTKTSTVITIGNPLFCTVYNKRTHTEYRLSRKAARLLLKNMDGKPCSSHGESLRDQLRSLLNR